MRTVPLAALLILTLLVGSCAPESSPASSTTTSTTASSTTSTTASSTTTQPPTTTTLRADAAPSELRGTWKTEISGVDIVFLTLYPTGYGIRRGTNTGSGQISVEASEIRFFNSSLCVGEGFYTWALDGESLTFTLTSEGDPCSGRWPILDGVTYTLDSRLP